jgi:hypothetical protein
MQYQQGVVGHDAISKQHISNIHRLH